MVAKVNKKLEQILLDIKSNNDVKIAKAIKTLETAGNSSVIRPLANLLLGDELSDSSKFAIIEMFSSLKDSTTAVEMMDVIGDPQFLEIRQTLLTTLWNTKVDYSNYIDEIVEIATTGTFMETLECLTIVENMDGPFMEEDILECQLHLKNYLENDAVKEPQKSELLSELALIIKDINENLMD